MSMAVASIRCEGEVTVNNSTCVKKSYPGFWKDFAKMGGNVDEHELG
jgi:3-phosphoshikimate 1-carboxyvinyltransferase